MIIVKKEFSKISITGHSMYDDFGRDIVCSAVSSIIITTINGILKIDDKALAVHEQDGIEIEVLKEDKVTLSLIENMLEELKELESKYPKNIKIKEGV
ncbi:MAG: ribosomal-processing cysteine protease Prp [Bacilli bacterium]|nr:ribosomal-processing cysteine protease Prp [Bacilli bacterium]